MSPARLAWDSVRPHAAWFAVAVALASVLAACRGGLVLLVRAVLDALQGDVVPTDMAPLALGVVGLFALQGAARLGRLWATRSASHRAEARLRGRVVRHLLRRRPDDIHRDGRGALLATLIHDTGAVRTAVGAAVTVVQRPLTAITVGGAAVWIAPRLGGIVLAMAPILAAVVVWTGRRTRAASAVHLERLGELQSALQDRLEGVATIQAYGAEQATHGAFQAAESSQVQAALRRVWVQGMGPPLVEWAAAVALSLVVVFGAAEIMAGRVSTGGVVAFLVGVALLHEPLKGIAVAHGLWEEARGGLDRVSDVLSRPTPTDAPHAEALRTPVLSISLRGVRVDRGRGPILRGLDLDLVPGRVTVVRGPSGAGKSTLLALLLGFLEADGGTVTWNGRPETDWTRGSLRARCAFVDQRPWLGRGTLGDAVRLGAPDADETSVRAALDAAGLPADSSLRGRLPHDLETKIGDGGADVSGGERRRIAIARALVRGAEVLLLDEPTSGLDADTEAALLATLQSLAPGRIVLITAHRAACASIANAVYELRDGRLVPASGARCA